MCDLKKQSEDYKGSACALAMKQLKEHEAVKSTFETCSAMLEIIQTINEAGNFEKNKEKIIQNKVRH